jgi:hypothetical protein
MTHFNHPWPLAGAPPAGWKGAEMHTTTHGNNIGNQIVEYDACGSKGTLNAADVLYIIDQIHTNVMDEDEKLTNMLSDFMDQIMREYPDTSL